MDAAKRFLRFKLAAGGAVLLGLGALAYSQGWVQRLDGRDAKQEAVKYWVWPGRPSPEQAAESLVESLDRVEGMEVEGPFLEQVVNQVLQHSPASQRRKIVRGLDWYWVQDASLVGDLAKRGVESGVLSEGDVTYLVRQGFDHLDLEVQRDVLLDLYRSADAEVQVGLVKDGLLNHPGSVVRKLFSDAYVEVRSSLKDAGDWTFDQGGEE